MVAAFDLGQEGGLTHFRRDKLILEPFIDVVIVILQGGLRFLSCFRHSEQLTARLLPLVIFELRVLSIAIITYLSTNTGLLFQLLLVPAVEFPSGPRRCIDVDLVDLVLHLLDLLLLVAISYIGVNVGAK